MCDFFNFFYSLSVLLRENTEDCLYFWGKIQKIVCTSEGNTQDCLYFWGKYRRLSLNIELIILLVESAGKKRNSVFPSEVQTIFCVSLRSTDDLLYFPSEVQMIFCIFPQKYRWSCVISLRSTDNEYKKFAKKAYFSLLKTKMIKIIYEKFDFFKVHSPP